MPAVTPWMGLKVWNELDDNFDHVQLAENFAKIDQHNHAEGHGVKIPTGGIEDGAISAAKIGQDQVTDEKILKVAVRGIVTELGALSVGTGFTVAKTGTGAYTITLGPALPSIPIVTGVLAGSAGFFSVVEATTTTVKVATYNSSGAATNASFHFVAYPS